MKKFISVMIIVLYSFSTMHAMQKQSLISSDKRPAIVYEFTWREACAASAVLSGPLATVLAGAHAYNYGLSLPTSIACSLGTVVTYGVILKALLCPTKKVDIRKILDF